MSPSRNMGHTFARMMIGLVTVLLVAAFLVVHCIPRIIRDGLQRSAATNYARFTAQQIKDVVERGDDTDSWQFKADRLSGVTSRVARAQGVSRVQVLDLDGDLVAEKTTEAKGGQISTGRSPITFNGHPLGEVVVSVATAEFDESWGSLGFLTVAHLAALTARNYGVLISDQLSLMIGSIRHPELWEQDAEKLAAILVDALRLDGVAKVTILDRGGLVLAERVKEGGRYETVVESAIVFNNNIVGRVVVSLEFPAIRKLALLSQLTILMLGLLSSAVVSFIPIRAVNFLEKSLRESHSKLEERVQERTDELRAANEHLARDLVERKKLEADLIHFEKMSAIGQMAAGIAHEINNPLGIILGFAQAVLRRLAPDDELALPIRSIERESQRCARMVKNLLAFSRRSEPRLEELDIKQVVMEALTFMEAAAKVRGVEFLTELTAQSRVTGDRPQLEQVLINLCSNALDAIGGEGGRVTVRTHDATAESGPIVRIEVEDDGAGIPGDIRDKIFSPFFTTKEAGRGTGLGLSLVNDIVERHHGTIAVRSEVGGGTTFTISLPSGGTTR